MLFVSTFLKRVLLLCVLLALALGVGSAAAQDAIDIAAIPIAVAQNQTGEITADAPTIHYALAISDPQSVNMQLLAISPALTPTFRVLNPEGVLIFDAANPGTMGVVGGLVNLASSGTYTIEVSAVGESIGQFLLSVQAGEPLADAEPLERGVLVGSALDNDTPRQAYRLSGSLDGALALTVAVNTDEGAETETDAPALVITLRDADTGETLSLNRAGLLGIRYRLPAAERAYLLELTQGEARAAVPFTVCLTAESQPDCAANVVPPAVLATPLVTAVAAIDPTGACQVTSAGGQLINVRAGAGMGFGIDTQLAPRTFAPVIGRLADNTWFQVNVGGVVGWVSAGVVTLGGNCAGVSIVPSSALPTAGFMPTLVPAVMPTTAPTDVPTLAPTADTRPQLDGSLSTGASTGFDTGFAEAGVADPFEIPFNINTLVNTSDAVVDVSYLGAGCSGFTTAGPQYHVRYASGTGALQLRFYFLGSGYDTLIIQGPNGSFRCQKTVNVGIQFDGAFSIGGNYSIWVTTAAPNSAPNGSLYVSELPTP